ncbi:toxin-antitoxin system, toxin component, RelE domain protein, partial [Citrobacter koseri]
MPHCRPGKRSATGRKKCGGFFYTLCRMAAMPYPAYRIVPHCRPGKRRAPGRKKCGGFFIRYAG